MQKSDATFLLSIQQKVKIQIHMKTTISQSNQCTQLAQVDVLYDDVIMLFLCRTFFSWLFLFHFTYSVSGMTFQVWPSRLYRRETLCKTKTSILPMVLLTWVIWAFAQFSFRPFELTPFYKYFIQACTTCSCMHDCYLVIATKCKVGNYIYFNKSSNIKVTEKPRLRTACS